MIRTILFVLFFIIMAIAIGITIWGGIQTYRSYEDGDEKVKKGDTNNLIT